MVFSYKVRTCELFGWGGMLARGGVIFPGIPVGGGVIFPGIPVGGWVVFHWIPVGDWECTGHFHARILHVNSCVEMISVHGFDFIIDFLCDTNVLDLSMTVIGSFVLTEIFIIVFSFSFWFLSQAGFLQQATFFGGKPRFQGFHWFSF